MNRDQRYNQSEKGKLRTKIRESRPYRQGYRAGYQAGKATGLKESKAQPLKIDSDCTNPSPG